MQTLEFPYIATLPDGTQEAANLIIETRVQQFKDDENVPNPAGDENAYFYGIAGDENAYFYGIAVNGQREQLQTFQPGEDGCQTMTQEEAESFLAGEIEQQKANFGVK